MCLRSRKQVGDAQHRYYRAETRQPIERPANTMDGVLATVHFYYRQNELVRLIKTDHHFISGHINSVSPGRAVLHLDKAQRAAIAWPRLYIVTEVLPGDFTWGVAEPALMFAFAFQHSVHRGFLDKLPR